MQNNYAFDYYNSSVHSTFSPTSPTFPNPYNQRFNGYNNYSSDQIMSPLRSPVTSQPQYPFSSYNTLDVSRPAPLNLTIDPLRRTMRELPSPAMRNPLASGIPILPANHATTMGPAYPTTPMQYNDQLQFLSQNPQYLSGLAGQALGTGGKVSRAIAAQLFARDENTDRFPCTLCGQSFKRINGLKRHLMMHLHIKPYKCEMCGRGFCRIDVYKRHVHRARCIKE
ncbi:hypothetical protein DSO57_1002602 [Entomophthora muscae]|uniref:Uncharacterized protein n=1 Tax=Entomophthora muscae TaxID=34485 RepID=A0ACC2U7C3_9FUNG|nr:hypothetical protein DSO57_1002602 [Entomophthora muscae]